MQRSRTMDDDDFEFFGAETDEFGNTVADVRARGVRAHQRKGTHGVRHYFRLKFQDNNAPAAGRFFNTDKSALRYAKKVAAAFPGRTIEIVGEDEDY